MEGDNAYLCEELGKRVPAVKRTAIRTLPQMLCVHLKRFEFDYHNQTRHKLRDRSVLGRLAVSRNGVGTLGCLPVDCKATEPWQVTLVHGMWQAFLQHARACHCPKQQRISPWEVRRLAL